MLKRIAAATIAGALSLLLAGCLLTPGKFASTLDLRKDGQFAFTYKGEISMLGLAQLAAMGKSNDVFKPLPCFAEAPPTKRRKKGMADDSFGLPERPCTEAELAEQKTNWEADRKAAIEKEKKDAEEMKAVFGGLDPTDPKSIEEFALRLRRQAGWHAVTYKGNGLFEVDFAAGGRLDHDFIFPVIEKFPTANTFVQVLRRADGTVRVDTPGFAAATGSNPLSQMMGMGALGKSAAGDKEQSPPPAAMEGTFTLTTNGQVLANNTDEGPKVDPSGQRLDWTVNIRTTAAPTALVRLGN